MAFFQNSVLKKHLNGQDAETVKAAYQKFTAYFHNPAIQQNIRDAKEEQFQEGFLRELFVDILGYTLNPQPNFNLTTELKNEKGAKKADGAILSREHAPLSTPKALAVIELKGTDTKDLDKINVQAFNYKNNQTGCVYVITSNFEKLRFFIHHSVEHLEFNLFTLTETEFQLLWLCLRADNLLSGVPLKVKEESLLEEEKITKQLYKDYAAFRYDLWQNMVKNSRAKDKLLLFKKTQKLLDRYLFIFFAEDSGLLPPNSISRIVTRWEVLKQEDAYKPLYDIFKQYFSYIDKGRKGQKTVDDIFAYNGGLFQPDEVLDNIVLDDEMLHPNVIKLTRYDFQSEVDVNILGHIFENSLNEIENITAELEGQEIDKSKTKRKKDGVFYTPKYITKYIVDNTVGKLCDEKKAELGIIDEEYAKGRRNRKKETIKSLGENLQAYRNWLLNITICDPACGSGAFLNQALEFLMEEHNYIAELEAQLHSKVFGKYKQAALGEGVENHILEKNIFGVDINEESVDIAKLSLWLRTAQRGRKLTALNNNIKCGNSLIDDPSVAGEKAFNWQKEFPHVFAKGGFDVVIGNPPYGAELDGKGWLKLNYKETSFGNIDSYKYFVQLGSILTKVQGVLSFIMPDSYLEKEYFKDLRLYVSDCFNEITNIKLGDDVFDDVNLPTAIINLNNKGSKARKFYYQDISNINKLNKPVSLNYKTNFIIEQPEVSKTFVVINSIIKCKNTVPLIEVYEQVMGVKVYQKGKGKPKQTDYEKDNDVFVSNSPNEKFNYPFISQGINRYIYYTQNEYISYGDWLAEPRKSKYFDTPKIVIREIINPRIYATYIEESAVVKNIAAVIIKKTDDYPIKFLLGLINSNLFTFYVNEQSPKSSNKSYPSFNSRLLKDLPIIKCSSLEKEEIVERVDLILKTTKQFDDFIKYFTKHISIKFELEKLSSNLQNWYGLEFGDFLKELKKAKVQLSLSEEAEWMQYFNEQKQKAQTLKAEINKMDREIDTMVYELYGLSEEEIAIVENSTK